MTVPVPHEWLLPRLTEMLSQAEAAGIPRAIAIAVIIDLVEGPDFAGKLGVADTGAPALRSVGPESEVRGGPEAPEKPEIETDD